MGHVKRSSRVPFFYGYLRPCRIRIVHRAPAVQSLSTRTVNEARCGDTRSEISSRFDNVVEVLTIAFGEGAHVLVFKTVTELHKEYSQRAGFTFGESLRDQIIQLRERVATDLLKPSNDPSTDDSIHTISPKPHE
ncbi:MAG: hypothetical protein AUF79_12715 [Crenarchaeota archaeon 13_1_20CM_2_51_8]|nr:MAG: hypothetical protein AUF79_12715 [Crenarchaeota archaeon 13_1_20CM_2_51_8]